MHTDEYEISLNRECHHCRYVINTLRKALQKRAQRFGRSYLEALAARQQGKLAISAKEMEQWRIDLEALPIWEQRLEAYQESLEAMRVSGPANDVRINAPLERGICSENKE
ncbi:MAG: hypothetical protein ACK5PS_17040 [Desulfopila sp.]